VGQGYNYKLACFANKQGKGQRSKATAFKAENYDKVLSSSLNFDHES
jgi:hypothetical protein